MAEPQSTSHFRTFAYALITIVGFLAICLLNSWIFARYYSANYWQWYLKTGPYISLATATFSIAWGTIDRQVGLVSANPLAYLGAALQVIGLPIFVTGTHGRTQYQTAPMSFNDFPLLLLNLLLVAVAIAWLILIAPMQYFLFLIAGSYSRKALNTSAYVRARLEAGKLKFEATDSPVSKEQEANGWWDASMRSKPVTFASAFGGAILYLIDSILKH